jgi:phage tail-like protein
MDDNRREPLGNMRFRLEIDEMQRTGAVEVVFPEARVLRGRGKAPSTYCGTLSVRRGVTGSGEWFDWWDRSRRSKTGLKRNVTVIVLDEQGNDVNRWIFVGATPLGYLLSNLNALGNEVLIETLELSVADLRAFFAAQSSAKRKK